MWRRALSARDPLRAFWRTAWTPLPARTCPARNRPHACDVSSGRDETITLITLIPPSTLVTLIYKKVQIHVEAVVSCQHLRLFGIGQIDLVDGAVLRALWNNSSMGS